MINLTQQKKIQLIQNQCVKLIEPNLDVAETQKKHRILSINKPNLDVAETRKKHRILSINELVKLENYKVWYREQQNSLPTNLLIQMREDHYRHSIRKQHNYCTHNKGQMNLPSARSKVYCNSFLFKGLREFQLLENEIKSEKNKLKFIRKSKKSLLC